MLNGELLRVAWRAISAHKLRSFLTLLGVIIGVMTVIAVVSVISGLNNYVATKLFSLSPDVYTIERFGIITSRASKTTEPSGFLISLTALRKAMSA